MRFAVERAYWFLLAAPLVFLMLFPTVLYGASTPAPANSPSIIVIVIDTLRADYLGSYGFRGGISPNLDQLADSAVVFERCYTQAPSTLPAVTSLFTSLHPTAHGVVGRQPTKALRQRVIEGLETNAIPLGAITLAEILNGAGYDTSAFNANSWLVPWLGFDRGFDTFNDSFSRDERDATPLLVAASTWIRKRPPRRPFFVYIHLMDVHGPYIASAEDVEVARSCPSLGDDRRLSSAEEAHIDKYLRRPSWTEGIRGNRLREWRARYAGGVHSVDRKLAPFIEWLRSTGVLDRSILVVTSDHGEELCEHGGWSHGGTLYDHQLHVPLLVHYPRGGPRGVRIETVVNLTDVMATLLPAAGLLLPEGVTGQDLTALVQPGDVAQSKGISLAAGIGSQPSLHSIQDGRYKLIVDLTTGQTELFDLQNDSEEQRDVSAENPELAAGLTKRLIEELKTVRANAPQKGKKARLPSEVEERLRALGYLH